MVPRVRFEDQIELERFLEEYPGMRIRPSTGGGLRLVGEFEFQADYEGAPTIADVYQLAVDVPYQFPKILPRIEETGGRIPREPDHHILKDGSLCLGSPLRLHLIAQEKTTLLEFCRSCLVPFLYAYSHRLRYGGRLPFGELAHDVKGVLDDYVTLFRLRRHDQAIQAVTLLGMKKRRANKYPCPCACGKRLGVCSFNQTMRKMRGRLSRSEWRLIAQHIFSLMKRDSGLVSKT